MFQFIPLSRWSMIITRLIVTLWLIFLSLHCSWQATLLLCLSFNTLSHSSVYCGRLKNGTFATMTWKICFFSTLLQSCRMSASRNRYFCNLELHFLCKNLPESLNINDSNYNSMKKKIIFKKYCLFTFLFSNTCKLLVKETSSEDRNFVNYSPCLPPFDNYVLNIQISSLHCWHSFMNYNHLL